MDSRARGQSDHADSDVEPQAYRPDLDAKAYCLIVPPKRRAQCLLGATAQFLSR